MSIKLRDLIKAVRACKTAAEEREVIAKESAALREAFRDQDQGCRHRNVAKLMYIHMLGYPTHFGQMETLKLIAATGFAEKRLGYLGLMLLLDERHEVLMLVTNSLKQDMNNNKNPYIVGLSLAALGNICSAEMARDLAPDVERLMESSNPYVRKKAALCAVRVVRKVPDLVEQLLDPAAQLLADRHQATVLAGCTLMLACADVEPTVAADRYRKHVPVLCKILRQLMQNGISPEHEIGGVTNPYLQVAALRLLRLLGRGSAEASEQMADILAQVASNIEGARNAGNAVLYECVLTVMGVEPVAGLRVLAVNVLGRFLANRDNNIRYVALSTLARAVTPDSQQAIQRHRATIVDCVKDADVSIRRRALELVYSLVNENNIRTLTKELLDYLAVSDAEFKPDLTAKICMLIQRFSPDRRWYVDQMLQVLLQAGTYVKEEVCRAFIVLVTNTPDLQGYATRSLFRALSASVDSAADPLALTALWCVGEFGEMLLPSAGGAFFEGEPPLHVTDRQVVDLLEAVLTRTQGRSPQLREYVLMAAAKLTARLPGRATQLSGILERHATSSLLEVQTRSCEFAQIFKYDAITAQLLERMPALDETDYAQNLQTPSSGGSTTAAAAGQTAAAVPAKPDDVVDLLALEVSAPSAPPAAEPSVAVAASNDLLDLLGGPLTLAPPPAASPVASLLGVDAMAPTPAADPLLSLLGDSTAPAASFDPIVVWQGRGLTVRFSFRKPDPAQPGLTEIWATYENGGAAEVSEFSLQAAVPKFMQLKLDPASSGALPPRGASIRQRLVVLNSLHGTKSLVMRLRMRFVQEGQTLTEQAEVSNFPPGL